MPMTKCPTCGSDVSTDAASCPKCGHQFKSAGAFSMKETESRLSRSPIDSKWLLLGGLALVLSLGVSLVDRGRASSSLKAAYTVRDAGEHLFSELASGFSSSVPGVSGV